MKVFSSNFLLLPICLLVLLQCQKPCCQERKIAGVNLVSPYDSTSIDQIKSVSIINARWVSIIPYAFSKQNEPHVYFNSDRQWWGERPYGTAMMIEKAHQLGLRTMLKPHVWMSGGWIGEYDLTSEQDWKDWENEYENYILPFAEIAQKHKVEMFCIGTELKKPAILRPKFWTHLITEVRKIYDGKITYAANWDDYHLIPFWDELDYIGIDAYFPLMQSNNPSVLELNEAWEKTKNILKSFSHTDNKPILFTEYGYQSANGGSGAHWLVDTSKENINMQVQAVALESLYQTYWDEPWFAGGFIWKWHLEGDNGGENDAHFTPQGKPALKVIESWYAK